MIVFRAGRETIPARLVQVQREHDATTSGATRTWRLHVEVDWGTWRAIDTRAWFHLAPEHRGPAFRPFTNDQPIALELRLRSPSALMDLVDVAAGGLADTLVATPEHALLDASKWYAATVMQAFPGTAGRSKTGFRTTWAEEHGRLQGVAGSTGR